METLDKFKTLEGLGKFISAIGWISIAVSVIVGTISMGESSSFGLLPGFLTIFLGVVSGIIVVASGQALQCLVAIEYNTRSSTRHEAQSESELDASSSDEKWDRSHFMSK